MEYKEANVKRGIEVRKKILSEIKRYIQVHGYSPSFREIGEAVGLKSTSSVESHIKKMLKSGVIETDAGAGMSRAIRVPGMAFVEQQ